MTATTLEVNELQEATVCVQLMGELERAIPVELRIVNSSDTDLVNITSDSNFVLTFMAGLSSGALECVTIGIISDGITECHRETLSVLHDTITDYPYGNTLQSTR